MPVNQTYIYISFITTGFDREVILNNTINFKSDAFNYHSSFGSFLMKR